MENVKGSDFKFMYLESNCHCGPIGCIKKGLASVVIWIEKLCACIPAVFSSFLPGTLPNQSHQDGSLIIVQLTFFQLHSQLPSFCAE